MMDCLCISKAWSFLHAKQERCFKASTRAMAFELELELELEFELELASSSKAGDSSPSAPTTRLNNVHGHPTRPELQEVGLNGPKTPLAV